MIDNKNSSTAYNVIDKLIIQLHRHSKISVQTAYEKNANCISRAIFDIKRMNDHHGAWGCVIENNISGHVFD